MSAQDGTARRWWSATAMAVVAALTISGCAGAAQEVGGPTPDSGAATTATAPAAAAPSGAAVVPTTAPPRLGAADGKAGSMLGAAMLQRLKADVAGRAGVDAAQVEVVSSRRRTFNDGSLDCPEPGKVYTQALVEGAQVTLSAGGERYDYRLSDRGGFKLCEQPQTGQRPVTPQPFPTRPGTQES